MAAALCLTCALLLSFSVSGPAQLDRGTASPDRTPPSSWTPRTSGPLAPTYTVEAIVIPEFCGPIYLNGIGLNSGGIFHAQIGADLEAIALSCTGYLFAGWNTSGGVFIATAGAPPAVGVLVSGNGTITAVYTPMATPPTPSSPGPNPATLLEYAAAGFVGGMVAGAIVMWAARPPSQR